MEKKKENKKKERKEKKAGQREKERKRNKISLPPFGRENVSSYLMLETM